MNQHNQHNGTNRLFWFIMIVALLIAVATLVSNAADKEPEVNVTNPTTFTIEDVQPTQPSLGKPALQPAGSPLGNAIESARGDAHEVVPQSAPCAKKGVEINCEGN